MPIGAPGWPELAVWTASIESVRIVLMASWSRSPATSDNSISHSVAHRQASLPNRRDLLRRSRATTPFYGPKAMHRRVEPVGPDNEPVGPDNELRSAGPGDRIVPMLTIPVPEQSVAAGPLDRKSIV